MISKSYIFAIDFDGTIVDDKFPEIGALKPDAVRVIRRLLDKGHKMILWTSRANDKKRDYFNEAINLLMYCGIRPHAINKNIDRDEVWGIPKVLADFYLDDKSFPPFTSWSEFECCMEQMGIL